MQSGPALSRSPGSSSYSSNKLAEIAARVVEELRAETESEIDDVFGFGGEGFLVDRAQDALKVEDDVNDHEDDDEEEEFAFVCEKPDSSPISADEIFYNGQIRPLFPMFNRNLLLGHEAGLNGNENSNSVSSKSPAPASVRHPLRKLFMEERDPLSSCSSSEADELDGVPSGTYCVWAPKSSPADSQRRCKKSNSTGSSKRWKFRDLLNRSNSDGKETFVFLTPSKANSLKGAENAEKAMTEASKKDGEKSKAKEATASPAARYARKKEEVGRRSYLPYRQDLVGFFANVNGLSRNLHPF